MNVKTFILGLVFVSIGMIGFVYFFNILYNRMELTLWSWYILGLSILLLITGRVIVKNSNKL